MSAHQYVRQINIPVKAWWTRIEVFCLFYTLIERKSLNESLFVIRQSSIAMRHLRFSPFTRDLNPYNGGVPLALFPMPFALCRTPIYLSRWT